MKFHSIKHENQWELLLFNNIESSGIPFKNIEFSGTPFNNIVFSIDSKNLISMYMILDNYNLFNCTSLIKQKAISFIMELHNGINFNTIDQLTTLWNVWIASHGNYSRDLYIVMMCSQCIMLWPYHHSSRIPRIYHKLTV